MRSKILFIFLLSCCYCNNALGQGQEKIQLMRAWDTLNVKWNSENGKIHGKYTSFYPNKKKKAEGLFENNYRIGKWTVWDSSGKKIAERFYENPFVYKKIYPKQYKDKLIQLLDKPIYTPKHNEKGFIEWHEVPDGAVFMQKMIVRFIDSSNTLLFENNRLFELINKSVNSGKLKIYEDCFWKKELNKDSLSTAKLKFLGYSLREVFFFDTDRFVSEHRIQGISPLFIDTEKKDTVELYWISFPELREYLAQERIKSPFNHIKTLDDLFFYRDFSGQITKESNIYDRKLSDYIAKEKLKEASMKIDIELVEFEHDCWVFFARNKKKNAPQR